MVVGTLSLVQNGKTSRHSGHSMQCNSGIVVYGGGDIVFGAKSSNQWMQYSVDTVRSMQWNSGIWWWGHCLWYEKIKPVDAVLCGCSTQYAVCSRIVVYGGGDIVFGIKRSNQWMQWTQYAVE